MKTSSLFRVVLLPIAIVGSFGATINGARLDNQNEASQQSAQAAGRLVANQRSLTNGVYAVLREGLTREQIRIEKQPYMVLVYDRKYSETDKDQTPKYVALDTSSFVPLILAGPPDTHKDDRGWTSLNVTLARQHVKTLEDFTRVHLGGVVAIVIDGEIITMHKVRNVIQDGKAQITRCGDDACRTLFIKLAK